MTKKQERLFTTIGIVIIIALSIGLIKYNLKLQEENRIVEAEKIENEIVDIEEDEDFKVPPIKAPKDTEDAKIDDTNKEKDHNPNYPDVPEYKEEIKEIDGDKVRVKSTPAPKKEKAPEAMKKPESQPKPKEPPKPIDTDTPNEKDNETDKPKNTENPPSYEKKEEDSYIVEKDGKFYMKALNGELIPIEGNPYGKPNEIDSSELGRPGEPGMGEGDKF